mmetsp:Transcript_63819/g.72233  ORF Transcript_63819/g.72233 Transcript_63819/m.72233 type:complete len:126 (-) Transcript_63819:665-1042(-)
MISSVDTLDTLYGKGDQSDEQNMNRMWKEILNKCSVFRISLKCTIVNALFMSLHCHFIAVAVTAAILLLRLSKKCQNYCCMIGGLYVTIESILCITLSYFQFSVVPIEKFNRVLSEKFFVVIIDF